MLPAPAVAVLNTDWATPTAAAKESIQLSMVKIITDPMSRLFFIAGIRDNIWMLLLQKSPLTLREAIAEAAKLEKVQKNKNEFKSRITSLADKEDKELQKSRIWMNTQSARLIMNECNKEDDLT